MLLLFQFIDIFLFREQTPYAATRILLLSSELYGMKIRANEDIENQKLYSFYSLEPMFLRFAIEILRVSLALVEYQRTAR